MKKMLGAVALASAMLPAMAADVGVSINVNQPGLYGRLDIGGYPQPQVVYAQPLIIDRGPIYVEAPPLYLHVPPGHAKNWRKHCRAYDACGRPVYFVRDDWYQNVYAPRYREVHGRDDDRRDDDRDRGDDHGDGNGKDKDKHKDKGRGHH